MADYNLPVPVPQPESDFYWEKAKAPRAVVPQVQRL